MPSTMRSIRVQRIEGRLPAWGNNGRRPSTQPRATIAVMQATSTGMKLRGFHSNSSNSTGSNTAAMGVPKTAVCRRRHLREQRFALAALRSKNCRTSTRAHRPS